MSKPIRIIESQVSLKRLNQIQIQWYLTISTWADPGLWQMGFRNTFRGSTCIFKKTQYTLPFLNFTVRFILLLNQG